MSFILDALKKSEAERQRQSGPTLLELRVTHPRRRYPIWVLVIGGLLAVNVIVLLFVALHRPGGPSATTSAAASAPLPATSPGVTASTGAALPAASSSASISASAKPAAAAAVAAAVPNAGGTSGAGKAAVPPLAAAADNAAGATALHNPADDEPAVSAQGPAASGQAKPLIAAGNYTALPSASSLGDSIPALQLNMLVSSQDTADRYALINMHRVREGDVLPEGARVLAITPDGVAMEYHGQDFLLPRAATPPPQ